MPETPERDFGFSAPPARSSFERKSGSCQPQCSQRQGHMSRFTIMESMQTPQMPQVKTVRARCIFQ